MEMSRFMAKPTPLTVWMRPMPRAASKSAAICMSRSSSSGEMELVMKSETAKNAS